MQAAKRFDFVANFIDIRRKLYAGVAAPKPIFHLCTRKLVQDHLHHGELVEVGIQQTGNDHVAN
jgi:hypothetical protein